jgi:hypothetical protein
MSQEINCVNNAAVAELMRGLRSQLSELITGLAGQDMAPMSLGLSHSLSRYKLKFSPDKVIVLSTLCSRLILVSSFVQTRLILWLPSRVLLLFKLIIVIPH